MQTLLVPTVAHEVVCQPIQEFWMRRRCSEKAEIARCLYQAASDVVEPDSIDENTSREWVCVVGQLFGVGAAAARRRACRIVGLKL